MDMIRQARIQPRLGTLRSEFACLSGLAALVLFCFPVFPADAAKGIASSTSLRSSVVRLPVIDKQDIRFKRLSINGESLQSWINDIVQDNYGFLWFGTSDGLYKYDGYSLKAYRHERGNPNTISGDFVTALYKDRDGSLWIAFFYDGLDRLELTSDTFTHYRHESGTPGSLASDEVACVYRDSRGELWIGTHDGLDRLDSATGTFVHYRHTPEDSGSLSSNSVNAVYEDRRGNLWVGTAYGLNKLDRPTGHFARFLYDPLNPNSVGHNYVGSILEDRAGNLWVGSQLGSGLSAWNLKTGGFTRYSFHAEEPSSQSVAGVNRIFEDREGALWVCTVDRGLLRLDRERRVFTRYFNAPGDPNSLPHDSVHSMLEDPEGEMWVGTLSGLSRFQRGQPSFVNYRHYAGNPNSLENDMIRSVQEDSYGFLWIGSEEGLNRLDRRTGRSTLYRHERKDPNSLSYDLVYGVREDRSGALWIATYGGGLDRFDRATGRFFAYHHDPKDSASLSSNAVTSLFVDREGTLWVGTQGGGLDRLDSGTRRFTTYMNESPNPDRIITVLFEDRAGMLWLGGPQGLARFDPKSGLVATYRHNSQDPQSLSIDKVNAVREDRQGRLWIGTDSGLNLLDRTRGTFTVFTMKEGITDNFIESILEDGHGHLWLGTHHGLSRFDPQTRTFRNYSETDGLAGNFLNPYGSEASCQTKDGEMFFGSTNGVIAFYPDRIFENRYVPTVVLTQLLLFNKPVLPGKDSPVKRSIWATDSLKLTHRQNIFTLEFAALSYMAPDANRYRYRLEGLETRWNEVDSRRRNATYTNLTAGKYTFRVQGSNNDGVWNRSGVALAITVLPPWWATWWFRSIVSLTIAALVFAAYRSRINQLKLRFEERLAERTHIAQELHDTLIQEVVAVGLQLDLIDDQTSNEPTAVKPTLSLVRQRVRHLIEHGRRTLCGLRSSTANTNDLIESLSRAGTELSSAELPHFRLFVQGDRRPLHSLIRDELDRIGREAITNAFRHANANAIEVGLFYSDHAIRLVVRDDGCGIAPNTILKGRPGHFGFTGMRERAERVGGRLTVRSRPGGGTEVNLFVPLQGGAGLSRAAFSQWLGRWIRWAGPRKDEFNGWEAGSDYEHAGKDSHTQC